MEREQEQQKAACDPHIAIHSFTVGDPVYARNYRPGPMWKPGYVTEIMGPQRYRVRLLNENQLWHRHQNQLRYRHMEDDNTRSAKITGVTGTSPITRDSLPVFPYHE